MHNSTAQQQQQINLKTLEVVPQVSTFLKQKNNAQNSDQGEAIND